MLFYANDVMITGKYSEEGKGENAGKTYYHISVGDGRQNYEFVSQSLGDVFNSVEYGSRVNVAIDLGSKFTSLKSITPCGKK